MVFECSSICAWNSVRENWEIALQDDGLVSISETLLITFAAQGMNGLSYSEYEEVCGLVNETQSLHAQALQDVAGITLNSSDYRLAKLTSEAMERVAHSGGTIQASFQFVATHFSLMERIDAADESVRNLISTENNRRAAAFVYLQLYPFQEDKSTLDILLDFLWAF